MKDQHAFAGRPNQEEDMMDTWETVNALDRILDDVMHRSVGTATNPRSFVPAIDVRTSEEEVVLQCDLPGVRQEDLELMLENHRLTIKGHRKFDAKDDEHVVIGRAYGTFSRVVSLGETLDDEHLSAQLADGVLTVRIPKQPKAKPRKIQIGVTSKQLGE
jgi:HSP20 family protein